MRFGKVLNQNIFYETGKIKGPHKCDDPAWWASKSSHMASSSSLGYLYWCGLLINCTEALPLSLWKSNKETRWMLSEWWMREAFCAWVLVDNKRASWLHLTRARGEGTPASSKLPDRTRRVSKLSYTPISPLLFTWFRTFTYTLIWTNAL